MLTFQDLIRRAKAQIREVWPAEVESRLEDSDVLWLDVREHEEFEQGAIPGAHLIPRGLLESSISMQVPDPETEMVVYCAGGARSALAAQSLAAARDSSMNSGERRMNSFLPAAWSF